MLIHLTQHALSSHFPSVIFFPNQTSHTVPSGIRKPHLSMIFKVNNALTS